MAEIEKVVYREKNLTIISAFGDFLFDQIIEVVDQFYASETTFNLLWDLSQADVSTTTKYEIEQIIEHSKKYAHLRAGGKTVFVMSNDLNFGLARMFEILSEIKKLPLSIHVFRKMEEALRWLEG